ncbi:alpha/beta fold hydrolase [Ghiorsea bivora]|uniref:alpha/beta fold hydrolase n=1 Tax=Ghiorsea bivora TaxID=1485545 RepID=UPI000570C41C|nr:alpha/beta fold hydrolase [Ghiorsea bivora]
MNRKTSQALVEVSELIELIYDTSQTDERWPQLLKDMDQYLQHFEGKNSPSGMLSEQVDQLSNHLLRSFQFNEVSDKATHQQFISSQLLDQLPIGVIVTNAKAEVITLNQQASESINTHHALSIQANTLQANTPQNTTLLHQHIQQLSDGSSQEDGISLSLVQGANQPTLSIWISTMLNQNTPEHAEQNLIAIYIISSCIKPEYDTLVLQKHFGLTAAETHLTKTLTNGCHNLVEAADTIGISVHTARTHMKRIFAKTQCSSQVELVKMILTSPAILKQNNLHPFFEPHPTHHSITLFDGRKFGYMTFGNPNAEPLIYCHALVHSDQQLLPNKTLQNTKDFHIIVPMRPGFLNSDWISTTPSLHDHAKDIIQLTQTLDISTFHVLGYSNGAPYASALAYFYPKYTTSLTLVAPIVPPDIDQRKDLPPADRYMLQLGKHLPKRALRVLSKTVLRSMWQRPDELTKRAFVYASTSEKVFLQSKDVNDYLKHWIQSVYPEKTAAVSHDLMVRIRPWGFELKNIEVPTQVWHAKDDTISPFCCGKTLTSNIPNAIMHTLEHGGHYILYEHFSRILVHLKSSYS